MKRILSTNQSGILIQSGGNAGQMEVVPMNEKTEVTFTEDELLPDSEPVASYGLSFCFRSGWEGEWIKNSSLTSEEEDLLARVIATIKSRWHRGCDSILQLFLYNLKEKDESDWFKITTSENKKFQILFSKEFGNIDYPVNIVIYR